MAETRVTEIIKGFISGGLSTFRSRRLTLSGIVRKMRMHTLSVEEIDTTHEDKAFVGDFLGGKTTERPCLFGFRGVLAKRKVAGQFIVTHLKVTEPPGATNLKFYNTTDCPLSSDGILKNFRTDCGPIIVLALGPKRFTERTLWDTFGDELD